MNFFKESHNKIYWRSPNLRSSQKKLANWIQINAKERKRKNKEIKILMLFNNIKIFSNGLSIRKIHLHLLTFPRFRIQICRMWMKWMAFDIVGSVLISCNISFLSISCQFIYISTPMFLTFHDNPDGAEIQENIIGW